MKGGYENGGPSVCPARRVVKLDPLTARSHYTLGQVYLYRGSFDEAVMHAHTALELDSTYRFAHWVLSDAYAQMLNFDAAIAESKELVGKARSDYQMGLLGHAYALSGRDVEARKIISELAQRRAQGLLVGFSRAMIHAGLGEVDEAMDLLEQAYNDREGYLIFLKVAPTLYPLHGHPRYEALLSRMGLA